MQLKKNLVRNIFFPIIERETVKWLDFYEHSQWWDPARLRELQKKKIRKMISYVYNNVPYYKKVFRHKNLRPEDIKNTEDLEKIPVLSHRDVRQNLLDLISANKSESSLFRCQTAGTTGHPLVLYKDKNELGSANACLFRGWRWCGYQIGEKRALIWIRRLVTSKYDSLKEKLIRFLTRSVFIDAGNLSKNRLEDFVNMLNAAKPTFLSGCASPIYLLAKFINERRLDLKFKLNGISTTVDPILNFQRKEIEKAFHCKVFDQYGCTEINSLGFECQEHKGLHIPIERVHIEFLDVKDGSPVSDGETGRIVVTCLENYGMPLIRYDTGDLAIKRGEFCTCGRSLPLMNSIVGRTIDLIRLPDGNVVYGAFFIYALEDLEWIAKYGIIQFQVIQKKPDYIILKIQSQKKPGQQATDSFLGFIKRHLGDIVFEIEYVNQIPVSASGKRRYIVSEVNHQSS